MDETLDALLRACIVQVFTPTQDGNGSGFFVARGHILTCAHVVEGAQPQQTLLTVRWQGHDCRARLLQRAGPTVREPEGPDLALLLMEITDHPCVLLIDGVNYTDALYTYGYSYVPNKRRQNVQGDSVSLHYDGPTDDGRLLKLKDGQVEPGLSGGPLLNWRTGGVCGVVKSTRDDRADLGGRAVPVATVLDVFPELAALQQAFHAQDRRWRTAQQMPASDREREIVGSLLVFLEDRRLLREEAGYQSHFPDHLRLSAQEIRRRTNEALQQLSRDSRLVPSLKRLQAAARSFQEETEGAMDGYRAGGGLTPFIPMGLDNYFRSLATYRQAMADAIIEATNLCGFELDQDLLQAFESNQARLRLWSLQRGHSE